MNNMTNQTNPERSEHQQRVDQFMILAKQDMPPSPTIPNEQTPSNAYNQLRAIELLHSLVDILGPCNHFDHHGYCQSHFVEKNCRVGEARRFLESLPPQQQNKATSERQTQIPS